MIATADAGRLLFREDQRFAFWAWAVPAVAAAGLAGIFLSEPPPGPWDAALLGAAGAVILLIAPVMRFARLSVEVRTDAIRIRFFPFSTREVRTCEIVDCYIRRYRPILEYGGYGVRYSRRHGWAYNVRGTVGVQLRLRDGRRMLIGSDRADALAEAVRSARA